MKKLKEELKEQGLEISNIERRTFNTYFTIKSKERNDIIFNSRNKLGTRLDVLWVDFEDKEIRASISNREVSE